MDINQWKPSKFAIFNEISNIILSINNFILVNFIFNYIFFEYKDFKLSKQFNEYLSPLETFVNSLE